MPVPYDPLVRDADGLRTISGVALIVREGVTVADTSQVSGSIGRSGTNLTLTDALNTLVDRDGPDAKGVYRQGRNKVETLALNYQFSKLYGATYKDNGREEAASGVYGIATSASDMPAHGTARFTGYGEISEIYKGSLGLATIPANHIATSTVDVDFATGKTNASLQSSRQLTVIGNKVDRISARGMQLNGSGFSGTNVKMFRNGTRVYPLGRAATGQASGQFYGAKRNEDGTLTPAEVGGVMHLSSSDGVVFGLFQAK
ncbi:MAG: transferrin-binding protein-like solute binding protein [Pseudomonadota bacterium]